jgi:hypothetical protein
MWGLRRVRRRWRFDLDLDVRVVVDWVVERERFRNEQRHRHVPPDRCGMHRGRLRELLLGKVRR